MKKTYKILFTLILLIILKIKVNALKYGGCDYTTIANLKSLVNNINISYTYQIKGNKAYFDVILNNVPKEVYFIDSFKKNKYTYSNTSSGEIIIKGYSNIQSGQYKFYVNNGICDGIKLGTKYYKFPIYNTRYKSDICSDIPNYSLCKKWVTKYYSDYEFEKNISEYKKSFEVKEDEEIIQYEKDLVTKIVEFYIKYYYYFLPLIIIICIIVMYVSKKKNSFKI